ncbi:MAG: helix-turn-helix domain-containing protein [Rhodobacteraceae bacterium]|nr:helix-turn-helix domain-containing protein [Paracoccaceae bacterium]
MTPLTNPPDMMTPDEVAAQLRVSRRTLDRYVKAGDFPAPRRWGRTVRWPKSVVDQHLTPETEGEL